MNEVKKVKVHQHKPSTLYDDAPVVDPMHEPSSKLEGKVALITGGDSGIGRSIAVLFALEGADIAIIYHESDEDAKEVERLILDEGRKCLLLKGDIASERFCRQAVQQVQHEMGKLSILINNAGVQYQHKTLEDIPTSEMRYTFEVNIFSMYYLSQEALKWIDDDGCIINTSSVTAFRGSPDLMDYSGTKGAIMSFTRALSQNIVKKGIRVNAVAPGPIWTPLIFESFSQDKIDSFGESTPMGRAGFPYEVAPAYLFLACRDSAFISGQVIHVNGGEIVG